MAPHAEAAAGLPTAALEQFLVIQNAGTAAIIGDLAAFSRARRAKTFPQLHQVSPLPSLVRSVGWRPFEDLHVTPATGYQFVEVVIKNNRSMIRREPVIDSNRVLIGIEIIGRQSD